MSELPRRPYTPELQSYHRNQNSSMGSDHVVEIWVANKEHLESMQDRISKTTPHLLSSAAGKSSCSIFRVPQSFVDINGANSYYPRIVSIGPYHRGKPHLQMIEEHKWRYLRSLLSTTQTMGISLENLFQSVHPLEKAARDSYAETIHLDSDEFLEMMILDGCFMLELFRKVNDPKLFVQDDPLVTMAWILPFFYRDFLRLENQIPFFVLIKLFEISNMPEEESGPSLSVLAMRFFNNAMLRDWEVIDGFGNLKGLHLLDLVRSSFIPPDHEFPLNERSTVPTHIIQSVSKLRRSGIRLNPGKAESFLVVKFKHGVLEMPNIAIDDFMSSFLVNCVAFEQCHKSHFKHVTTYVTLLDYLVNSAKDVEYLTDRNIIENNYGTEGEVARFLNNMGKDVAIDLDRCYLSKVFNDVHDYHQSNWHVQWASFKYTYFDTPWSFISAFAAFVLLVLSFLQTFYTICAYIHP